MVAERERFHIIAQHVQKMYDRLDAQTARIQPCKADTGNSAEDKNTSHAQLSKQQTVSNQPDKPDCQPEDCSSDNSSRCDCSDCDCDGNPCEKYCNLGNCCDFGSFGHKLFVTTPELVYLVVKLSPEIFGSEILSRENTGQEKISPEKAWLGRIKPMPSQICPYRDSSTGKCSIYDYRFASCRIFCCNVDEQAQSAQAEITEQYLRQIKTLCNDLGIEYRYQELSVALNNIEQLSTYL